MFSVNLKRTVEEHFEVFFYGFLMMVLLFFSIPLFLIVLFSILDYYKNIIELKFYMHYFPIKFIEVGIIVIGYYFSFFLALILVAVYFFNKFMFGRFDDRSLFDIPSIITVAILSAMLSNFDFVFIATSLFILRYLFDIFIELMLSGNLRIRNIPARIINTCIACFIFNMIQYVF